MTFPLLARVWFEGRRIAETTVISVECDGDEVTLDTPDGGEIVFEEGEWDDLTVQYDG